MNKKLILSLGMAVLSMVALASCKPVKHEHTFGGAYQHDSTQHWKVCDRDGCEVEEGRENHHGGTATCTELAKCEDCGVSYGSKAAHAYTESKVDAKYLVSAADCDSAAVYYKSCVCGEKGTETFTSGEALGHTFTEWATKTPADCLNAEVEERSCACGHKETRTGDAALGHDLEMKHDANQHWEECKREGCEHATAKENHKGGAATATEQAKCSVCGTAYGELADHEHTFVEEVLAEDANLAEAADCDNAAKYYKVCEHCGAYSEDTFSHGNALGHSYGAWTITVEPTETTVGSAERVCSRNNAHKETKELPVLTDTTVWTSAVTEPECGVKGKTTYTSEYGVVEVEIAALEHNYEGQEWLVSEEGTGGHYKLCKLCNEPSEVEAHRGGEATETEQATCEVCNNKYGETLDHTHSYVVEKVHSDYLDTAADCVNNATYYKSCSCGESSKGTEFEATFEDKDTALGHATADELDWIIEEDGHSKKCSCGHVVIEKAAHEGGEATCAVKAVCTVCKASYGELDSEHAWGEWSKPTLAGVSTRVCANDATHKEENNNAFGTKENPLTVAETKAAMSGFASGNKATVKGWIKGYVVSAEYTPYNGKDQWEYFIVDSLADTSSRFQLYGCYTGGVTEGDFIVATGYFKKFNSTYEFDYSNTVESIVHNDYPINTEIEYADDVDATVTVNIVKSAKSGENVSFTLSGDEGCKVTVTINGTTTLEPVDGTYSFVVSYKNDIRIFVEPKKEGAVEETWSHTFASGQLSNNNTKTLSNKKWTLNLTGGTYIGWDSNNGRGIQLGKSSAAATKATLKSSEFPGTIKSIVVNSSIASGGKAKISISVNGVSYLASTALTTTAKDYVGTGTQSGEIVISWTNTAKAFYIKSIEIVYEEYVAPSCEHEGGEATCKELAVCTKCGESYGELNVNNHKGTAEWTKDADSHKKVYSCCNKVVVAEEAHEWENGVCKECEYVCTHTERTLQGKEATCTEKGLTEGKDCSVCGKVLVAQEEIPMLDHNYSTPNYDNDNHWNECSCGAKENVEAHAHAYAYINDNGTLKYVGTCECGHIVSEVVEEKEVSVSNEADLRNVLASGHNAVVESNLDLSTRVEVTKAVTVTVKENATLSVKNDTEGYGVFHVLAGGELTLNGKGTIDGLGNNPWSICIFADGGKVIIEEGNYTNVGAHSENDGSHFDLIYVKNGGTVTINGGTFICETPKWTLNSNDTLKGTFVVKGGTFYGYNPADNTTENPVVNWVAEGYHASKVGDNYEVVACEANETKLVVDGGKLYEVVSCSCGYELSREEVNAEETVEVSNKADLLAVIESGYNVKLTSDVEVETAIVVAKDVTVDLNGKTISLPTDTVGDGVFHVTSGATLTINGEGTVNGVGANDYNMAIWADGGHVVINGGTYTNVGATANVDPVHFDLIYVKNGGTVTINGGTFTCETPKWTLNSHDTSKGTFVVKGGTFYGYNPADNTTENPVVNWVAEGYHASKVGDNYEVVACEHSYEANVTAPTVDADGYTTFTCSKCGDEYVEVDEGTNLAKASVNGKNYLTVEEAIAAAEEGDTVTLVKDLTYKDILVINKSIILDGNNKTLTSTAGRAINVSGTLTVTIKNLIINCSGERGINLIGGPSIVTIEKCNIKAANYAINLANSASGAKATIIECEITGCNSVNVGAANSEVIIKDSVINSIDNVTYEGYAAIALNKDGAKTEITATNTEINILGSSCEDTVKAKNHTETGKISIGSDSDIKIDVAFIEFGNYYYGYRTLAEAIEEALEGQTIGLLRNVEVTESLVINKQITIDLRGYSITVAEGYEVENIFDVAEGHHVVKVGDTYVYGEHSYESETTAPTCTADGYTTHTCTVCDDTYTSDEVAALGHSWAENWSSDADTHWHECTRDNCEEIAEEEAHEEKQATCENAAVCKCGKELEAKKDHSYTGDYVDNNDGTHSQKCVNGCQTVSEGVSHSHTNVKEGTVSISGGKFTIECVCGNKYTLNVVAETDTDGVLVENASKLVYRVTLKDSVIEKVQTELPTVHSDAIASLEAWSHDFAPQDAGLGQYVVLANGKLVEHTSKDLGTNTDGNKYAFTVALNANDVMTIYNNGTIIPSDSPYSNFITEGNTNSHTVPSKGTYTVYINKSSKAYVDGSYVSEQYATYTLKVNGVENPSAAQTPNTGDYAKFVVTLAIGEVATVYGGEELLNTTTAEIAGEYTFFVNSKNEVYVTEPVDPDAQEVVLYLKPNANWKQASARFAAYFFGNGEKWVDMTDSNGDGIYEVVVPAGFENIIFCRMNPGTTSNTWNSKWNQTGDLKVPTDGTNCYTVKEGTWDKGGGSWSTM